MRLHLPALRRPLLALAGLLILVGLAPAASAKEAAKGNTATYTSFNTLTATIWWPDGTRKILTVQGGVDVEEAGLRSRVAAFGPILRDAYVRALNVYAQGLTPGAPPDADQIALRLQRATDAALRRPGARVLLGTVMVN